MSYINMDHAAWVERNIAAAKRLKANKLELRRAGEHKGWHGAPDTLNPFQRRAVDILGIVGNGIYNAPICWKTVEWSPRYIALKWRNELATFDFIALTRFVFLCHEARIRGSIGAATRVLEIQLHQRGHEGAHLYERHPDLAEALASWRKEFPADHPIVYRAPQAQLAETA